MLWYICYEHVWIMGMSFDGIHKQLICHFLIAFLSHSYDIYIFMPLNVSIIQHYGNNEWEIKHRCKKKNRSFLFTHITNLFFAYNKKKFLCLQKDVDNWTFFIFRFWLHNEHETQMYIYTFDFNYTLWPLWISISPVVINRVSYYSCHFGVRISGISV